MSKAPKHGSMREALNNIMQVLREDEKLMKLLYYSPETLEQDVVEDLIPTDEDMARVIENDVDAIEKVERYREIIESRLLIGETKKEIEEDHICRVYVRFGRLRSVFGNYLIGDQEVVVNVYVPNRYDRYDYRLAWINDRISYLLTQERISGIGKMIYSKGDSRVAPHDYARYENIYMFTTAKKGLGENGRC